MRRSLASPGTEKQASGAPGAGDRRHEPGARAGATYIVIFAVLAGLTTVFYQLGGRYAVTDTDILLNADFEEGDWGWFGGGEAYVLLDEATPVVRLEPVSDGISLIGRRMGRAGRWDQLRFSADFRAKGLIPDGPAWRAGGLIVRSYDDDGRRIRSWPYHLLRIAGDQDWQRLSADLPVGAIVERLAIYVFHAGVDGVLEMRGLRVDGLAERPWSMMTKQILVGAWLLFGLRLLLLALMPPHGVCRYPWGRWRLAATAGLAVAILVGAMLPVPELRSGVGAVDHNLGQAWRNLVPEPDPASDLAAMDSADGVLITEAPADPSAEAPSPSEDGASDESPPAAAGDAPATTAATDATEGSASVLPAVDTAPATIGLIAFARSGAFGLSAQQVGHLFCFIGLGFCLSVLFPAGRLVAGASFLAATASTEIMQQFLITRSVDWADALFNAIGLATGLTLWLAWQALRRGPPQTES